MRSVRAIFRPLLELFVEDGSLAAVIVGVVLLAGFIRMLLPGVPSLAGAVLLIGCLGALAMNLRAAAR